MIALFFAVNIGASGAAASMGIAYGSGAINRHFALLLCGIGIFLGAILGGGEVVKTLGTGIIPESIVSIPIALIILSSASITLFIANLGGIPLSTSEVTVGAVVGVGIAFKILYVKTLIIIVFYWLALPLIAFLAAFLMNKGIAVIERKFTFLAKGKWPTYLAIIVILTGFMEAFSAGMNNVANAVGPLVAAGLLTVKQGTIAGGFFVALGAYVLGKNIIETNGKRITDLNLLQGISISSIGATLIIIASLFGIPVPQTQVTTCCILGAGAVNTGKEIWKKTIITKLLRTWVFSPVISLIISYYLVKLFINFDSTGVFLFIFFLFATYLFSLWKADKAMKPAYINKIVYKRRS